MKTKTLLREDFRRIVGLDEILEELKDPDNNPRILGGYGIVYYDKNGNAIGSEGSFGKDGKDGKDGADADGDDDEEDENDEDDGDTDAGNKITPGSKVTGIKDLYDCITGQKINVSITKEPDKSVCEDEDFEEGFFWDAYSSAGCRKGNTSIELVDNESKQFHTKKEAIAYILTGMPDAAVSYILEEVKNHPNGVSSAGTVGEEYGESGCSEGYKLGVGFRLIRSACTDTRPICKEKPKRTNFDYYFDQISRCFRPVCPDEASENECKRKLELCDKDGNKVSFDVFFDTIDIRQDKFKQISNIAIKDGKVNFIRRT